MVYVEANYTASCVRVTEDGPFTAVVKMNSCLINHNLVYSKGMLCEKCKQLNKKAILQRANHADDTRVAQHGDTRWAASGGREAEESLDFLSKSDSSVAVSAEVSAEKTDGWTDGRMDR